jgi:hypothetical protein
VGIQGGSWTVIQLTAQKSTFDLFENFPGTKWLFVVTRGPQRDPYDKRERKIK